MFFLGGSKGMMFFGTNCCFTKSYVFDVFHGYVIGCHWISRFLVTCLGQRKGYVIGFNGMYLDDNNSLTRIGSRALYSLVVNRI